MRLVAGDVFRASFPCTSSPFVNASPRPEFLMASIYVHFTALIFVPETMTANTVTLKIRAKEFGNMRKILYKCLREDISPVSSSYSLFEASGLVSV